MYTYNFLVRNPLHGEMYILFQAFLAVIPLASVAGPYAFLPQLFSAKQKTIVEYIVRQAVRWMLSNFRSEIE